LCVWLAALTDASASTNSSTNSNSNSNCSRAHTKVVGVSLSGRGRKSATNNHKFAPELSNEDVTGGGAGARSPPAIVAAAGLAIDMRPLRRAPPWGPADKCAGPRPAATPGANCISIIVRARPAAGRSAVCGRQQAAGVGRRGRALTNGTLAAAARLKIGNNSPPISGVNLWRAHTQKSCQAATSYGRSREAW
jgi:hypothetical protein